MSNYVIMCGDTSVAIWGDNHLVVLNETLLPLYFKKYHDLNTWLELRAIDHRRTNSRLLKKALRLAQRDDVHSVLHVNAATITDNYWVKTDDSPLQYRDVRFDNDYFSTLALRGTSDSFSDASLRIDTRTPELTNTGSYEKCWKLKDQKWWLQKSANLMEQFSELFICNLGKNLGFSMAEYKAGNNCIESLDFTNAASVNFEPAYTFMGEEEDYEMTLSALDELCPAAIPDYIRMIFLDAIVTNPDRHTANFGLLRDTHSGQLLGLAPLFDHNMALISRGYPERIHEDNVLIRDFNSLMNRHPDLKKFLPAVTEDTLRDAFVKTNMPDIDERTVRCMVMGAYQALDIGETLSEKPGFSLTMS